MDRADIYNRFRYHAPDSVKADRHAEFRVNCMNLAEYLNASLPEGREKSLAVTHLEEVMFWGNAALARNRRTAA